MPSFDGVPLRADGRFAAFAAAFAGKNSFLFMPRHLCWTGIYVQNRVHANEIDRPQKLGSTLMLGCMTRHLKIGFLVALIVAIIATASLSVIERPGNFLMILLSPGLPGVYCLRKVFPPPWADSPIAFSFWQSTMNAFGIGIASAFWGFIAGLLSKYAFRKK